MKRNIISLLGAMLIFNTSVFGATMELVSIEGVEIAEIEDVYRQLNYIKDHPEEYIDDEDNDILDENGNLIDGEAEPIVEYDGAIIRPEDMVKDVFGNLHDIDEDGVLTYEVNTQIEEGTTLILSDFINQIMDLCDTNTTYTEGVTKVKKPYTTYFYVSKDQDYIEALTTGKGSIKVEDKGIELIINIEVVRNTSNKSGLSDSDIIDITPEIEVPDEDMITGTPEQSNIRGYDSKDKLDIQTPDIIDSTEPGNTDGEAPVPAPNTQKNFFTDIQHRGWAVGAINNMADNGILKGVGNSLFKPDLPCKRCDFLIATVKMADLRLREVDPLHFQDIVFGSYYEPYLNIGVSNKVIANTTVFRPNENITREEAAILIYNTLVTQDKIKPSTTDTNVYLGNKYSDVNNINESYKQAITTLSELNIMTGTSSTTTKSTFKPKENITRAQMAVLLNNVYMSYMK